MIATTLGEQAMALATADVPDHSMHLRSGGIHA